MDEYHNKALSRIKNFEKNSKRTAFHVLSWLYYAKRPLRTNELLAAVALSDRDVDIFVQAETSSSFNVKKMSEGLLVYDENSGTIGFSHSTVQEFLKNCVDNTTDDSFTDHFLSNVDVAMACLNCIGSVVFKECKPSLYFSGYGRFYRSLHALLQQNTFLPYSVQFWSLHAREAEKHEVVQQAIFRVFASKITRIGVHIANEPLEIDSYFQIEENYTFLQFAAEHGLARITDMLLNRG